MDTILSLNDLATVETCQISTLALGFQTEVFVWHERWKALIAKWLKRFYAIMSGILCLIGLCDDVTLLKVLNK